LGARLLASPRRRGPTRLRTAPARANAWGATDAERETAGGLLPRVGGAIALLALALLLHQGRTGLLPAGLAASLLWPSVLCLAIPAGVLFGTVWAVQGRSSAKLPWRSLLGVASLAGLVAFALAAWITPRANHSLRRLVMENMAPAMPTLSPGDRELNLMELSEGASRLHASGRHGAAARLEVEWHKKPALGASCLAFALAGAVIARRLRSSLLRWPLAILLLAGWSVLLRLGEQAADQALMAPAIAMWGPGLVVGALAASSGLAGKRAKGAAV